MLPNQITTTSGKPSRRSRSSFISYVDRTSSSRRLNSSKGLAVSRRSSLKKDCSGPSPPTLYLIKLNWLPLSRAANSSLLVGKVMGDDYPYDTKAGTNWMLFDLANRLTHPVSQDTRGIGFCSTTHNLNSGMRNFGNHCVSFLICLLVGLLILTVSLENPFEEVPDLVTI
jgi:hypothetical protein